MLPVSEDSIAEGQDLKNYEIAPTKTYKIDLQNKRIMGMIEDKEALLQHIRKVFSTDKYAFEIYNWYYGHELLKLVGHEYDYVVTRIPNIFREALLVDNRITDINDFVFTRTRLDAVLVSCVIDTVYGQIKYEQEVLT